MDIPILDTWSTLNAAIVSASEEVCTKLLKEELATQRRHLFVMRIHSRLNKVRAARERLELSALLDKPKGAPAWLK